MKNLLQKYRVEMATKRYKSGSFGEKRHARRRTFSAIEAVIVLLACFYSLYWALSISLAVPTSNSLLSGLQSESWTALPQNSPTLRKIKGGKIMAFETPASNSVTVTPRAATAATSTIATPTNLVGTAGDGKVYLSWEPVQGANGYKIYRGTGAGGRALLDTISPASVNTPQYTDGTNPGALLPSPVNGTTYMYHVTATSP